MSSRYGYEDAQERENAEVPLPTYEEVVSAASNNIGFKTDVLLAPASVNRRETATEAGCLNTEDSELHYEPRRKSSNKRALMLALVGLLLIPLGAMVIIIQVKVCAAPRVQPKTDDVEMDRMTASYRRCMKEKYDLQRQFDGLKNNIDSDQLLKDYETSLSRKQLLEANLKTLQGQIKELNNQQKKLQQVLASSNNDDSQAKKSNSVDSDNTSTDNEQTSRPLVEKQKSTKDRLDELFNNPGINFISFQDLIHRAESIINAPD